jgi:hypothetical protein
LELTIFSFDRSGKTLLSEAEAEADAYCVNFKSTKQRAEDSAESWRTRP